MRRKVWRRQEGGQKLQRLQQRQQAGYHWSPATSQWRQSAAKWNLQRSCTQCQHGIKSLSHARMPASLNEDSAALTHLLRNLCSKK